MGTFSLIWGICAILGMLLAMIPLLGWLNWLNIPFAILGLIVSAIGMSGARRSNAAVAGLVLCLIATVLGGIRLMLGGFIL
ncbi:hypothetical protein CO609_03885 [Lysobacteraceae bacterium NML91-0268]|nr:hypothetical protein CO609_03885 [Xanthomonadaceae bacterium NML91-0268]